MPAITSRHLSLAFDMHGCPNRCRHCYLGRFPSGRLTQEDVRSVVRLFRGYARPGQERPFFETVKVVSWTHEPDYSDDYARLYALEQDLSDGNTYRREWELLSIWRLARDEAYAPWAARHGPPKCQISLFGMEETTDWFYRRRGAFRDCLAATERLLAAGIQPRWQLFLTTRILPELGELLRLVEKLRLPERVAALGGQLELFLHPPGPDGEARALEPLRPTLEQTQGIPAEILERSRRHLGREVLWRTEAEWTAEMDAQAPKLPCTHAPPDPLFFVVQANWDVFTNTATGEPWWRLGNLKREPLQAILDRYEANEVPGLRAVYSQTARELAARYGDASGRRVYESPEDLVALWVARHCEREWHAHKSQAG